MTLSHSRYAAHAWTKPRTLGQPPTPRSGHSATRCGEGGPIVVFGGINSETEQNFNDVHWLALFETMGDCGNAKAIDHIRWEQVQVEGTPPEARNSHTASINAPFQPLAF